MGGGGFTNLEIEVPKWFVHKFSLFKTSLVEIPWPGPNLAWNMAPTLGLVIWMKSP